jgi:hypothetical protein
LSAIVKIRLKKIPVKFKLGIKKSPLPLPFWPCAAKWKGEPLGRAESEGEKKRKARIDF